MKVLIVGNGGRESAIAHRLKDDSRITQMFFAKGNATTENFGKNIYDEDINALRELASREKIDLTIVGPELPLVNGIVDEFKKHDLRIFGPTKRAAALEGSKAFSKKFMQENGIRTAKAEIFDSYVSAKEYIKTQNYPLVIKASGLASGKGVVICNDEITAEATLHKFMIDRIYGDAGIQVVVEEFLNGFEASIIAFCNGETLFPCIPAKDYKKSGNNDKGQNTGGMGSVAPTPEFTSGHMSDFEKNILEPTLLGLKDNMIKFQGFIYFGLMVANNQCYLLEYNMRLGDPEAQVILPLLENNLIDTINDCIDGKDLHLEFSDKSAVCLVMCSGGYPGTFETGFEIKGVEEVKNSQVLFAGAENVAGRTVTNGGRVLNLVAVADSIEEAREKVYEDAKPVHFDYAFYREDIAKF